MSHSFSNKREASIVVKVILALAVVLLTGLGVVGLILPILPGIVFLALAAWLFSRLSRRFAAYLDGHQYWQRWQRWLKRSATLSATDRCRLAGLLVIRGGICGLERIVIFLSPNRRQRPPSTEKQNRI